MGFYSTISDEYDNIFVLSNNEIKFIESFAYDKSKILDVACGTGQHSVALAEKGYLLSGFDLNKDMIKKARMKNNKIDFKVLNMLNIEKEYNNLFDLIFCFGNSLVHLNSEKEIEKAIRQMYALLKDDSYLLLQNVNFDRILKYNIRSLPIIKNDNIIFEREYELKDKYIIFKSILKTKKEELNASTKLIPLTHEKLKKILIKVGFRSIDFFGSFNKEKYSPYSSYPMIVAAKK